MYNERQTYPSRRYLNHSNSTTAVDNQSETPQVRKITLGKMAIFPVGPYLAHSNGNEVVKIVRTRDSEHGTKYIPLITKPITPVFTTKNRGCLGGGISPEAIRRAKRKARLATNHNHNGNK